MPRTREQFQQMKNEMASSILDAALPLFAVYGTKVSIDAISEKAKCSHGNVYHYFKNTDQIYETLLNDNKMKELKSRLLTPIDGSSYEKITNIVSILLEVSKERKNIVGFLYILLKNTDKTSLFSLLCKLIKDGQNAGKIVAGEPENIVECLFSLLRGIYLPILIEKHPTVKVPSLEIVMQLIRKPISF